MKTKLLLVSTLLLGAFQSFAQTASNPSTLPFYDGFNYTVGGSLVGQGNWTNATTGTVDDILVAGSMSYPGLPTSVGNSVNLKGSGSDPIKYFTDQTTGTVYYSFLVTINDDTIDFYNANNSVQTAGLQFISLGQQSATTPANTNYGACVFIRRNDANGVINFGYTLDSTTSNTQWSSISVFTGTTYLIVASYTFDATAPTGKMWINPVVTPAEPAATVTSSAFTNNRLNLDRIYIRQDSNAKTPNFDIDELRIGTSWNQVTGTTLGVNSNVLNSVSIYPNPAKNSFNIKSDGINIDTITVFNLDGKTVLKSNNNTTNTVDVSSLTKGVYLVKLQSANDQITQKLIIE
jgi:hypothetical protein